MLASKEERAAAAVDYLLSLLKEGGTSDWVDQKLEACRLILSLGRSAIPGRGETAAPPPSNE